MSNTNTASQTRYSYGAMIFHWVIAVAVIVNWRIVENAHGLKGAARGDLMNDHKALGIAILVLTVGRLLWRWTHPRPPLASHLAAWEKTLAKITHFIFYLLLIALPLGGWLANSFAGRTIDFFGLFTIGTLPVGESRQTAGTIFELHGTGANILLILVALHVLGVVKHMAIDRDGQLWRMLPFGTATKN
ncbi:cytochrome b [Pseudoblastomonas halimionae]|uniref:Cytochrome b n=1 Tax=Alteriqipengyuania halimionae TaxID=1926630 RepID=A0A6I4U1D6_9SPHN|nr:cytochrome b [Alteriqipengyuania halimionae]MXP09094.1 cytochrome b [Alteriqipengyuania halimionae]